MEQIFAWIVALIVVLLALNILGKKVLLLLSKSMDQ